MSEKEPLLDKKGVRPPDLVCIIDFNSESIQKSSSGPNVDKINAILKDRPLSGTSVRWIDIEGHNVHIDGSGATFSPLNFIFEEFKERAVLARAVKMDPLRVQFLKITPDVFLITLKLMTFNEEKFPHKMSHEVPILFEFESVAVLVNLSTQTITTLQEGKEGDIWEEVRTQLESQDGLLRNNGTMMLLWALVDASLEVYGIFVDYLKAQLALVCQLKGRRSKSWFAGVLKHNAMLLFAELETHVSLAEELKEIAGTHSAIYFKDLFHRFRHACQDCNVVIMAAQDLQDRMIQDEDERHAKSSYIISVVLAVFSPLSFITGLYGMNFTGDENGDGIMPELTWTHGYQYVWILMGSIAVFILWLFFSFKVLEFPVCMKKGCGLVKRQVFGMCFIRKRGHAIHDDTATLHRLVSFRTSRRVSGT